MYANQKSLSLVGSFSLQGDTMIYMSSHDQRNFTVIVASGHLKMILNSQGLLLLKTKSQLFNFTNEDEGARFWGENLLAQRGREKPPYSTKASEGESSFSTPSVPSTSVPLLSASCVFLCPPLPSDCLLCLLT